MDELPEPWGTFSGTVMEDTNSDGSDDTGLSNAILTLFDEIAYSKQIVGLVHHSRSCLSKFLIIIINW